MAFGGRGGGYKPLGFGKAEAPFEVMVKRRGGKLASTGGRIALDIKIDSEGLDVAIGAASLCDYVSRALLQHHADAIEEGRRPSGGAQAPLDPEGQQGRKAAEGRRPNIRGNTGTDRSIPRLLKRSEVRSTGKVVRIGRGGELGFTAHATIYPGAGLQGQFISDEADQGIEYFAVTGDADRVIEQVVVDYLATVFDGVRHYDPAKTKAR